MTGTSRRKRILVVEDDAIIAAHLSQILTRLGHEIAGLASTGEDAIASVEKTPPDILIMDIRLKGSINGVEAGRSIFKKHNLPIVFVSAFADPSFADRTEQLEPFSYLPKPFKEEDLQHAVKLAFFKHAIYAERVACRDAKKDYEEKRSRLIETGRQLRYALIESLGTIAAISEPQGDEATKTKLSEVKIKLKELHEVLNDLGLGECG